ncbi:MAG: hypothetical protein LBT00_06315 [Spirochaetaceae bacterium]|nr:hypothetical protein [Spirochaetaceae bacterium]
MLLVVFSACGFETPQRVMVSSTFDLHVPVGDIGQMEEVQDLLEYLKIEKIREFFEEAVEETEETENPRKANVFYYYAEKDYTAGDEKSGYVIPLPDTADKNKNAEAPYTALNAIRSDEVRTLFIHFPLSRMDLDFSEYMKTEIETPDVVLPDIDTPLPPGADIPGEGFPVDPIPLGVMNEWVTRIKLNDTAKGVFTQVRLIGGAELNDALELAIPGLGIGANETDFQQGVPVGEDLVFTASQEKTLNPQVDKELSVYPRLVQVPPESGGSYHIVVDLKWTEADVNPGKHGDYHGLITLPLKQLADILEKYKLKTLPCYLYVGGPFDGGAIQGAKITLDDGKGWKIEEDITKSYDFSTLYTGLSLEHSFNEPLSYASTASFNLAAKVNEDSLDDMHIEYLISLGDSCIVTQEQGVSAITADLVILLPMQTEVVETEPEAALTWEDGRRYTRMMELVDYSSEGDLFGRDKAGVSISRIENARVSGTDADNTIFAGDLFLRIYDNLSFDQLFHIEMNKDFSIDIAGDDIPMPFQPKFAVYVEKPEAGNAVVKIESKKDGVDDKFSMKIKADVSGEAEYEQGL